MKTLTPSQKRVLNKIENNQMTSVRDYRSIKVLKTKGLIEDKITRKNSDCHYKIVDMFSDVDFKNIASAIDRMVSRF